MFKEVQRKSGPRRRRAGRRKRPGAVWPVRAVRRGRRPGRAPPSATSSAAAAASSGPRRRPLRRVKKKESLQIRAVAGRDALARATSESGRAGILGSGFPAVVPSGSGSRSPSCRPAGSSGRCRELRSDSWAAEAAVTVRDPSPRRPSGRIRLEPRGYVTDSTEPGRRGFGRAEERVHYSIWWGSAPSCGCG